MAWFLLGGCLAGISPLQAQKQIGLKKGPNISLNVEINYTEKEKLLRIEEFIDEHPGQAGIVYCLSRANTEKVAAHLRMKGYRAACYHAGLSNAERQSVQQRFLNDDIDIITRMPAKYAASARKTLNKQCYEILLNNPAIYDGVKLFDSKHANLLATGTGITREALQGMIMALSNQKDEFGEVCIIRPATIIVPSGYKFEMYTIFFSPTINTEDNTQAVNPLYQYRESIEIVEDPTINAMCGGFGNQMPWWLLGAKEDTDFVEVDYLNGQDVPNIRRSEVPGTLGFVWDIYLDWGISVMDYRGAIMNPGVVVNSPVKLA